MPSFSPCRGTSACGVVGGAPQYRLAELNCVSAAVGLTLSLSLGPGLPSALFLEESWAVAWAHLFVADAQLPENHTFMAKPAMTVPFGSAAHAVFTPRKLTMLRLRIVLMRP